MATISPCSCTPSPSNITCAPGFNFWPGCISASHVAITELIHQQAFDRAAAGKPPPEQPSRKHPGVVQDEEIALMQVVHQAGKRNVFELTSFPVQHQ